MGFQGIPKGTYICSSNTFRAVAGAALSKFDIVEITDFNGAHTPVVTKASASSAAPVGTLFMVLRDCASGDECEINPGPIFVTPKTSKPTDASADVTIDASGGSAGSAVELSSTAGAPNFAADETNSRTVGVIVDASATVGEWVFDGRGCLTA